MRLQSHSWASIWRQPYFGKIHAPCSTVDKRQNVEATGMSMNRRMDKKDMTHVQTMEYYSAIKWKEIIPLRAS